MVANGNRTTEFEVALATLRIAASRPDGKATFYRLRRELPQYLNLSAGDMTQSTTRPGEQLWEQLIRNIKSHSDTPGNIICDGYATHVPRVGYRITDSGRHYLNNEGC